MNTTYGGLNERIDSVGGYDPATLVTPDNEYNTHFTNGRFNNVLIKFQ